MFFFVEACELNDLRRTLASRRLVAVGWFQFFLGGGFEPMLKSKWTCPALMSEACLEYFFVAASLGQFLGYAWTEDFFYQI